LQPPAKEEHLEQHRKVLEKQMQAVKRQRAALLLQRRERELRDRRPAARAALSRRRRCSKVQKCCFTAALSCITPGEQLGDAVCPR
jgi:hypothetical protein